MRLNFPLTENWISLTQDQAVGGLWDWAYAHAPALAERQGQGTDKTQIARIADHLESVGRHYLEVGGIGCLLLVPSPGFTVEAMVRLETFRGPSTPEEFQAQCKALVPPAEWLIAPASVQNQNSPAGPVTKIHFRWVNPDSENEGPRDTFYWMWWFPDGPETGLASIQFANAIEARRWADEVEGMVLNAESPDGALSMEGGMPEGPYGEAGGVGSMTDSDVSNTKIIIEPMKPSSILIGLKQTAGASIVADRQAGTLTWTPDGKRARSKGPCVAPLPGRGAGAVTQLVIATYSQRAGSYGDMTFSNLLFVTEDGTCLWAGHGYLQKHLQEIWPTERLARLFDAGIEVKEEEFSDMKEMAKTYPGAVSKATLRMTSPAVLVPVVLLIILIITLVVLAFAPQ